MVSTSPREGGGSSRALASTLTRGRRRLKCVGVVNLAKRGRRQLEGFGIDLAERGRQRFKGFGIKLDKRGRRRLEGLGINLDEIGRR